MLPRARWTTATTTSPSLHDTLLTGRLIGHRVVLITLPGSGRKDVDSLARTLQDAGAQIAGRIDVNPDFFAGAEQPDGAGKAMLRDQAVRSYGLADVKGRTAEAQLAGALVSRAPRTLDSAAAALVTEQDRGRHDRSGAAVLIEATWPCW